MSKNNGIDRQASQCLTTIQIYTKQLNTHLTSQYLEKWHESFRTNLWHKDKLASYDEYLVNLITQLHTIQKNARENVIKAKIKFKKNMIKRYLNSQTFRPGDQVFLLKGPKLGKFGENIYRFSQCTISQYILKYKFFS